MEFDSFQEHWAPANRKVIRGIGGVPEGSSLAIPSIAREGGDLPPPTTGRNSLHNVEFVTTRNPDLFQIIPACFEVITPAKIEPLLRSHAKVLLK